MPQIVPAAMGLPPKDAIAFLREKTAVTSAHWTDIWKQAHARSFMVAGAASQALVEDFHREVVRAIEHGTTLADFRTQFDAIVAKHGWEHNGSAAWRANIIYETNLSMAYAAGRYAQMTQPATLAVFPYWQYVHSGSRHPRPWHLAWNGLTLRADDPFWSTHYPPNGWHCGCHVRVCSGRDLQRMGKNGPDASPPLQTRPWRNPRTGVVHDVPVGIDPGFDYNVGEAWQGPVPTHVDALKPGEATLRPLAPEPVAPKPGVLERPGALPPRALPPDPAAPPIKPPTRKPPVHQPATTYPHWIENLDATKRADGSLWAVATLPAAVPLPNGAARSVTISARRALHLLHDGKTKAGRALPIADVMALGRLLAIPLAVVRDRETGTILLIFQSSDPGGRLGKVVVELGVKAKIDDRASITNAIISGGLLLRNNLWAARYELLAGAL